MTGDKEINWTAWELVNRNCSAPQNEVKEEKLTYIQLPNYDTMAEAKQSNGTTINKMNGYAQIENCTNRKNSLPTEW
ncbi:MAG: hypothetical protein GY820_18955 [Gammaproteobacteria bacterium]|nr:hypothetical protein [Gammaproteobacteria bacterium]